MAEPLTDKELAEFRRRVEGLHDMSLGTSMRVGMERRILATITRLEADLKALNSHLDASLESQEQLEAQNEAKAAALRAAGNRWHRNRVDHRPGYPTHTSNVEDIEDCLRPECVEVVAALSDTGKGWPEVREQVLEALGAAIQCEQGCGDCKLYLRAALDALKEGK